LKTNRSIYKVATVITLGILIVAGGIFYLFNGKTFNSNQTGSKKLDILQKWELPEILEEISGIAMIDGNRIAAIQDEEGKIFIYNLQTLKIESQHKFSGSGDYEGIAVVGETAYILESDGTLYEVPNFQTANGESKKFTTALHKKYNFEGLTYDKKNNRLLLAIKDIDDNNFKPIFSFDLALKELEKDPAIKINLNDTIFDQLDQKKSHRLLRPSEIGINPVTGNYYILEGVNPKLLIMDPEGNLKKLHILDRDQFRQAEGITFSPTGEIYISNEGKGGLGNILKVSID
jgi:hypothetical protein